MKVRTVAVERFSLTSAAPFESVMARIDAAVGHPDMRAFVAAVGAAPTVAALEDVVAGAVGSSGIIEFTRFDIGEVLRKDRPGVSARVLRLLLGNPLIMRQMAEHARDAGSYAPVTVLVDERQDGVHLSYDRMASLLAPYGSAEALVVARALDQKIESLLTAAAA
jgi:uncharacterized protein (DUF302 family)